MNIGDFIQQQLTLLFVRPFSKEKPIEYKTVLRKASRILILFPQTKSPFLDKTLSYVKTVFPKARFTLLNTGNEALQSQKHPDVAMQWLFFPKQTYWTLSRSAPLSQLTRKHFDLFLDLETRYNLFGSYLCRSIDAPIRIGIGKSKDDKYYNFLYNGKADTDDIQKMNGLLHFLKSFVKS
jgi:hypothetical protein